MKRINRYAYPLAFFALTGLFTFTSCSSSDEPDEPNVNPSETVKTSFSLSVGLPQNKNNAKPVTRVADNIAQTNGVSDFRGIDNITLIPFNTTSDITSSDTRFGANNITLPNATPNSIAANELTSNGNAKVYSDVTIAQGTNHFLFYGKAIDASAGTAITEATDKFTYGSLDATGLEEGDPSGISFTPSVIYSATAKDNVATALETYLNSIISSSYTPEGGTTTTWATYAGNDANKDKPLAQVYNNLVKLQAGSSAKIESAIQEVYASLSNIANNQGGNSLTSEEAGLRNAIIANILGTSNANATATDGKLAFASSLNGYPDNIDLPDGAATLTFSNGAFSENTGSVTLSNNNTQIAALNRFTYPANLWYFANTPIKTSDAGLADQYTNDKTWDNILALYSTENGSVGATTRSIALTNQIQYAVARLQTTVKAASETLKDQKGNDVTVNATTFPVTAILVGGQRVANWQFQPSDNTTQADQYTMYDKTQTGDNTPYATTSASKANNTLVLESPENVPVNIAVELTNNSGSDFYGKDGNIIKNGAKFYLIAQLDPTSKTENEVNQPDGKTLTRVFQQDYITNANLTINANTGDQHNSGLGAAYDVIPDLRIPGLSIGMSVDLTWQTGLTFNVDM